MPSTQTLRSWYPELVTVSPSGAISCDYSECPTVRFYATGQPFDAIELKVHPAALDAFRALAATFRHFGYPYRERAGGTTVCRKIAGSSRSSLHAHGIALDINPSTNSYRRTALGGLIQWGRQTDMPKPMVDAAKGIRTVNKRRVFGWGGDWRNIKDPMHWQVECRQEDLATGIDWSTVKGTPNDEEYEMTLKRGDRGNAVRLFQICLNHQGAGEGLDTDGIFGEFTDQAVRRYQGAAQVSVTGQIDGVTGALLLRYEEE